MIALLLRWAGWREKTMDMHIFFQWYNKMQAAGGWRGLSEPIGNYNAPFLYFLALATYLPGPVIFKIKALWVIFDVVLAWFTYRMVSLHRPGGRAPIAAALLMVLLPSVVINASFYGQMDAMWAAPALAGVYYLLRDKPWLGVALCTVSFAVKPQGIFIFPLIMLLVLAGRVPWRTLLIAPVTFVALDLPAFLIGRDPMELLSIYDTDRQARNVSMLTHQAPSVWAFVPAGTRLESLRLLGYLFAAALVFGLCYILIVRAVQLTHQRIVTVATLFTIMVPFLLPGMHERYFFLADVMALMLALMVPRLWYVALLVQGASLLSYEQFLFGRNTLMLPLVVPATLMLAALIVVGHHLLRDAFTTEPALRREPALPAEKPAAEPSQHTEPALRRESATVPDAPTEVIETRPPAGAAAKPAVPQPAVPQPAVPKPRVSPREAEPMSPPARPA